MPTIPASITVESCEEESTTRVHTKQFGKGYKQISQDGINAKLRSIDVIFSIQTQSEAIALIALLSPASTIPVDWQPPIDSTVKKWLVPSYRTSMKQGKIYQVSCRFELWNEP